jgi:hypothetical protein
VLHKIASTTGVGVSVANAQRPWTVVVRPLTSTLFLNRVIFRLHRKIGILPLRVSITTTLQHQPIPTTSAKLLHPLSPPHNQCILPPPQFGTTDPKSPLANHLQVAPWPPLYRATPSPKCHGNADPRKFLMSYEAVIASAGGDETTLAKSLIISLEDATTN